MNNKKAGIIKALQITEEDVKAISNEYEYNKRRESIKKERTAMAYKFTFSIVHENNDKTKDKDYSKNAPGDYDFNQANMKRVFDTLNPKRAADIAKADYLKSSMPDLQTVEAIAKDIEEYYYTHFAHDEFSVNEETKKRADVKIRFFLHVGAQSEDGDYTSDYNEICIFCKNIPNRILQCIKYDKNERFTHAIERIAKTYSENGIGIEICFLNYMRYLLAHEMFHMFHDREYRSVNGKPFSDTDAECIVQEVFAEYFAFSYMTEYLESAYPEMKNTMWNHIFGQLQPRVADRFGIGRKSLLKEFYSADEISDDEIEYQNELMGEYAKSVKRINGNNCLSAADYAGGYKLYRYSDKKYHLFGVKVSEYTDAYKSVMEGNSKKALYDLIEL